MNSTDCEMGIAVLFEIAIIICVFVFDGMKEDVNVQLEQVYIFINLYLCVFCRGKIFEVLRSHKL